MPSLGLDSSLIVVFFVYGLALYTTGLAILLEVGRGRSLPISRVLWSLAAYALLHGTVEWLEMLAAFPDEGDWLSGLDLPVGLHLALLAVSSACLVQFGASLLANARQDRAYLRWVGPGLLTFWAVASFLITRTTPLPEIYQWAIAGALARYLVYLPAAVLSALAMFGQRRTFREIGLPQAGRYCVLAAGAFALDALLGGLVVPPAPFFPATVLNYMTVATVVTLPVPLLRAAPALIIAFLVVRILRTFETEQKLALERMNEQLQQLSTQVITAQEEERKRIARDLHDDTAQVLSSLVVRLGLLQQARDIEVVRGKAAELMALAGGAAEGVRRLASDLRPAALDDLGLLAALQLYVEEYSSQRGTLVDFKATGRNGRLPASVELSLYRIVQEALNNVAKHADASHVKVRLAREGETIVVTVQDDGRGFDAEATLRAPEQGLGLFGMQERAALVGGRVTVQSRPGAGTVVTAEVPAEGLAR